MYRTKDVEATMLRLVILITVLSLVLISAMEG